MTAGPGPARQRGPVLRRLRAVNWPVVVRKSARYGCLLCVCALGVMALLPRTLPAVSVPSSGYNVLRTANTPADRDAALVQYLPPLSEVSLSYEQPTVVEVAGRTDGSTLAVRSQVDGVLGAPVIVWGCLLSGTPCKGYKTPATVLVVIDRVG